MDPKLKELQQERAEKVEALKKMIKGVDDGKRKMNADELDTFGTLKADIANLDVEIGNRQFVQDTDQRIAQPQNVPANAPAQRNEPNQTSEERAKLEEEAFVSWVRHGEAGLSKPEYRSAMNRRRYAGDDVRAYTPQTVTTTGGGYLVPEGFSNELEKSLKAFGGVRQVARNLTTPDGRTIPWPTVDDTGNVGELVAINTASDANGQAVVYGSVSLAAYKFSSKAVLVPIELLQDSFFPIGPHLNELLTERIGRITNTYFTTGTGSNQPHGVVAASTLGYTGATGTNASVTYNGLTEIEHSVDPAYRPMCKWMFNDATLKIVKQLVDEQGRPLWLPQTSGVSGSFPATLLGYPYVINQDMASMSAAAKSILFGDFSKFIVRDVMPPTLFRLDEKYIESGQVAFLAWSRHDSRCINTAAIKHYVNGAAS
jgi:HK97 family phage major capsid protein